ncbi:hypothetical protein NKI72_06990 [Mesorhizobium sp. M0437]|uniref:hypothetical protein n=1 Tax=unclassified Mesorhizobium TaxID=325217 RepID=UPI00333BFEA9
MPEFDDGRGEQIGFRHGVQRQVHRLISKTGQSSCFTKQTGCPVLSICYRVKMSAEISARPSSRAQKRTNDPEGMRKKVLDVKQPEAPRDPEREYVEAAILHRQLLEMGDVKGSNAAHDRLIRAIREIRNRPDLGRSFLLGTLRHTDENVRFWSAGHLLPLEEKMALADLKSLARDAKSSVVSLSADVTATEWRRGTLNIDWFMKE